MAVSKRLRFEILRRDNHTCRYCGGTPPDVILTVDHVIPVALGGSDDPHNLVAACKDCNAGKTSSNPDAPLVDTVADDALRWAAAMKQAAEERKLNNNTAIYEAVVQAWSSFRRNQIPGDYRETIDQFLNAGLPADDIVQMAHVADAKPSIYNRWAYFCGCCWKRIEQMQERAQEIVGAGGVADAAPSPPRLTTSWTAADIAVEVAWAKEFSDGVFVSSSVLCKHKTLADVDSYCDDPVCQAVWAKEVVELAHGVLARNTTKARRNDAIMDELDRLELQDG
ncbi:DNA-directed RNA polymerase subunit RPC12/RpoP [Mycobacterium frederiksbergense]|uniref:DNA-directed RNA polymerase subunit RPC12/RpoP n=1 Tax=Mycolicibacterium frederiksbergense TaxID=117567 RepID=A0ABT6LB56_9MYCO|nr:HNH endonuclease [Mycolicibacterium frederiksbergense]MDH6199220.1 DNA-directed RNA polymerase subunit RPC12/RpoP [Mycolicibacterium frederiksbergense]